ncbi:hypothetical protein AADW59_00230 [Candidatus Hodgkinia cicadicola]
MLAKLIHVLKRVLLTNSNSVYLAGLVAKFGVLHEMIGDDLVRSFYCKQLELVANVGVDDNMRDYVPLLATNTIHAISAAEHSLCLILNRMGFEHYEDEEICDVWSNFYSLNFSRLHPSLDVADSFYVASEDGANLLRTHATSGLVKRLEVMPANARRFTIGKVYRRDNSPTHLPSFTQLEGIVCGCGLSLTSVVCLIKRVIFEFLGFETCCRIRKAWFPFTEPSLEIDLCCSERFSSFKHNYGWLEVVGLGLVRREILASARSPQRAVYAFGLGLERLVMLKLDLNNISQLYDLE